MGLSNTIFRVLFFIVISIVVVTVAIGVLGYHGQRDFHTGNELPTEEMLIRNARTLIGTPYDPFMGMHGNIGAKLGFVVCSDVPNIAYGLSGYSLRQALKRDYSINPSAYDSNNGNNPRNPYFHRRARNLYAYFRSTGRLMPASHKPSIGDLAFYRKSLKSNVAHVALVSTVTSDGYKIIESAPKTVVVQEVSNTSPIERGWILSGFGNVY
jgi:uncharacterized protein YijF (DUF1287 family)